MDNKILASSEDLCRIIETCAKSHVRELKLDSLFLQFGLADQPIQSLATETKFSEQASQEIEAEATKQLNVAALQQDLDELKISDPLAYEQLLGGNLEDGTS